MSSELRKHHCWLHPISRKPKDLGENRSHALHPMSHDFHPEANEGLDLYAFEQDNTVILPIRIFHLFSTWKE